MQSVETIVQLSFGWTHEDLWLRVYRKSVVAVPVEVAPRAQRCRVKGQSAFDRIRQPQSKYHTQFSIYLIRNCWREAAQILLYRNSSASKFYYPIIYALHRWTQIIIRNQSSLILEAHNLKQQSSESRKIRGEADAISTQRPFSKFEFSHLFLRCWQVLVSPTPGEQNRWHLFSIWTTITSRNYRCIQANEFYFIVARSQRLNIAARMSFEPANLFTCDSNYYLINFIQSIHAEIPYVGAVNTRRFNSGYSFSISIHPLFYRRNRSLVKSTSGFARSHSRFIFDRGSRILQSLLTKNQSAIC